MSEQAVQGQTTTIETEAELAKLGEATTFGLSSRTVRLVFLVGVAFAAWQIYTAAYSPFSSQVMRSVRVGFLMLMAFLIYRVTRGHSRGRYSPPSDASPASVAPSKSSAGAPPRVET